MITMPPTPTLTGQDIAEAQGALAALLDEILRPSGTTPVEYIALRVLALRGPVETTGALREFLLSQRQLGLDADGADALLARLQSRGFIEPGPGPVRLTETGSRHHAELTDSIAPSTRDLFDGFDPDDLALAHRVLERVKDRAGTMRAEVRSRRSQ